MCNINSFLLYLRKFSRRKETRQKKKKKKSFLLNFCFDDFIVFIASNKMILLSLILLTRLSHWGVIQTIIISKGTWYYLLVKFSLCMWDFITFMIAISEHHGRFVAYLSTDIFFLFLVLAYIQSNFHISEHSFRAAPVIKILLLFYLFFYFILNMIREILTIVTLAMLSDSCTEMAKKIYVRRV